MNGERFKMQKVDELVFDILRQALFDRPSALPKRDGGVSDTTMAQLFRELNQQTVLCFADKWFLENCREDCPVYEQWRTRSKEYQLRFLYVFSEQQKLVRLLEENGVRCVIIKGMASAMYYPDPFLRLCGDIDFLVKRKDFDRTAEILEANGFEASASSHADGAHHSGYVKASVVYELHRRIPIVDEKNEELLRLFEEGIDQRIECGIGGLDFPTLPHRLNGVVLLFHINQHLRVGLGLRQILDWMMFVNAYIDNNAWESEYRPLFERVRMDKFAKTVTKMCIMHLGLSEEFSWCADADAAACDKLIEYIMSKGNFGVKAGEQGRVSSVFLRHGSPAKLLARLQQKGLEHWSAAKEHAVLRPFAWLYELIDARKRMKKSGISVSQMRALKKEGERNREFIESIGLDADRVIYEME